MDKKIARAPQGQLRAWLNQKVREGHRIEKVDSDIRFEKQMLALHMSIKEELQCRLRRRASESAEQYVMRVGGKIGIQCANYCQLVDVIDKQMYELWHKCEFRPGHEHCRMLIGQLVHTAVSRLDYELHKLAEMIKRRKALRRKAF